MDSILADNHQKSQTLIGILSAPEEASANVVMRWTNENWERTVMPALEICCLVPTVWLLHLRAVDVSCSPRGGPHPVTV